MPEELNFEDFWDKFLALLQGLFKARVAYQQWQSGWLKCGTIHIRDRVTEYSHIVAVKYSERKWPIPPSLAHQYEDRFTRQLQTYVPQELLRKSDITVIIVGKYSRGVAKLSRLLRKLSRKTKLTYFLNARGRTTTEQAVRAVKIVERYYKARTARIREVRTRLEEQGLDTSRLQITQLETFFMFVTNKLREGVRLLTGKDPDTVLRQV